MLRFIHFYAFYQCLCARAWLGLRLGQVDSRILFFLVSLGFTRSAVLHSFGYVTLEKIKFSSPFHQSYGWTRNAIHTPQKWQVELWPHTNENRLVISICQSQGSRVAVNPAMINPEQGTFKLLYGFTIINSWWYHVRYFDQILLKFIQVHMHYM